MGLWGSHGLDEVEAMNMDKCFHSLGGDEATQREGGRERMKENSR